MSTSTTNDPSPFFDFPEMQARYRNCSRGYVYAMVERGELPAFSKRGNKILWLKSAVLDFEQRAFDQAHQAQAAKLAMAVLS